jgi:DUF2911 family protein
MSPVARKAFSCRAQLPVAVAILFAKSLSAQASAFLTTLGRDTMSIEQYTRAGNTITGDWVTTYGGVLVHHYVVTLRPNGTIEHTDLALRRGNGRVVATVSLSFDADSITIVASLDSGRVRRVAGTNVFTTIGNAVGMVEPITRWMRSERRDSAIVSVISASGPFTVGRALVVLFGTDSGRTGNPTAPTYLRVDAAGNIQAVSARATTLREETTRISPFDLAAVIGTFADVPPTTRIIGVAAISPRDTARGTAGDAQILIDYGRPALRGRDVFSHGVLGDTLWRTGANAATQFNTSADLVVGGQTIPAGKYSLWTSVGPNNSSYSLVFNRQVGQWGTEHHAEQDFASVPLTVGQLAAPVERFTIAIERTSAGSVLRLLWGAVELTSPITVR